MQKLNTHKKAFKVIKKFHHLDHSIVPVILLIGFIKGVVPFIPIIFSKYILSAVIEREYIKAIYIAIIMSIIFLIGNIIGDWVKKILRDKIVATSVKIEDLVYRKPITLDYESMEDGKVIDSHTSAISSLKYKGNYSSLISEYYSLLQGIVSFSISVGLTIKLCFSRSNSDTEVLNVLMSPLVSGILMIAVILGVMGVMGKGVKYCQEKVSELFEIKLSSEKRFGYLCRMFRDNEMIKIIQSYGADRSMSNLLMDTSISIRDNYKKESRYWVAESVIKSSASSFITILAYTLVALKILSGAIGVADFIQYSQGVIKMNQSLLALIINNHKITDMIKYLDKLTDFLDMENKFETGTIPIEKRSDRKYHICFEDVWFKYPGSDEYVIKGLSCEINSNIRSALVGPNGAGKSTFIKLLNRLYEPTKGRITLNGVDIKKYDYKEYLSLFSVVFQDFGLFSFSLGENVASSIEYQDDRVKDSLKRAGMEGYNKNIDEKIEGKYSGGEKQKIAIARALYKDAPFVILDEPTAALDPISEYEIYQKFNSLVEDKTCIYISHRMSSCRFCSDIIVLNEGEIVERGPHEELINDEKLYYDMWSAQAKYYTAS